VIEHLETRDVPIAELTFFPGNARRGNVPKIRQSVRRLGQYRSVVVRHEPGRLTILAGNHTVRAMRAEGHETARCEIIRCTDDEAIRVNVADNRLADVASDDTDALLELLSTLDGDYDGTGWSDEDIHALITPPEPPAGDGGNQDEFKHLAVVVVCDSETDQQAAFEFLADHGYRPRTARLSDTLLSPARR